MCVIAVKPKNVSMPDDDTIRAMWDCNPDGAGFMWADGKSVHISKGYMTVDELLKALKKMSQKYELRELPMVLHFRIGTAGGNIPENTHPFTITDSIPLLQKKEMKAHIGVAHNGVIPIEPRQKDISDTMEYIASQLAPLYRYDREFYRSKDILNLIYNATHSKWAIMNAEGDVVTIGDFQEREGILYSNLHHEWYSFGRYNKYGCIGSRDGSFFWEEYDECENVELVLLPPDACLFDEASGQFMEVGDSVILMDFWGIPYVSDLDCSVAFPINEDPMVYDCHMRRFQFDKEKAIVMPVNYAEYVPMGDLIDSSFLGGVVEDWTKEEEDNENG